MDVLDIMDGWMKAESMLKNKLYLPEQLYR